MVPPKFLFIPIYASCNLRCPHCTFWERPHTLTKRSWADGDHKERRKSIVAEFAKLNPAGTVVTHGGESLMAWDEYMDFSRLVRSHGLRLLTVTNGTMIHSLERAGELAIDGPSEISISFDSPRLEIHDKFRGAEGAFAKATSAVIALLRARFKWHSKIRVYAILLVGKSTCQDLDYAYDFALNELGVDKLKLNLIQPSFGRNLGEDPFFAEESQVDPDKLREALLAVDAKYALKFNPAWIAQATMYFRSLRFYPKARMSWQGQLETTDHICNSYDRNIWVTDHSQMYLCCDSAWPGALWEKPGDLEKFWTSSDALREMMSSCNRLCGISHSLRNTTSTLK